jgi:hypothetical protein
MNGCSDLCLSHLPLCRASASISLRCMVNPGQMHAAILTLDKRVKRQHSMRQSTANVT